MGHDNEWTVATLKAYFEALRIEDQRADKLAATDIRLRLDRLSSSFDELKISVERFHSTFQGGKTQGDTNWLRIVNIVTLLAAIGTVMIGWFHRIWT